MNQFQLNSSKKNPKTVESSCFVWESVLIWNWLIAGVNWVEKSYWVSVPSVNWIWIQLRDVGVESENNLAQKSFWRIYRNQFFFHLLENCTSSISHRHICLSECGDSFQLLSQKDHQCLSLYWWCVLNSASNTGIFLCSCMAVQQPVRFHPGDPIKLYLLR